MIVYISARIYWTLKTVYLDLFVEKRMKFLKDFDFVSGI